MRSRFRARHDLAGHQFKMSLVFPCNPPKIRPLDLLQALAAGLVSILQIQHALLLGDAVDIRQTTPFCISNSSSRWSGLMNRSMGLKAHTMKR
jgi:hypothetical protein